MCSVLNEIKKKKYKVKSYFFKRISDDQTDHADQLNVDPARDKRADYKVVKIELEKKSKEKRYVL